MRRHKMQLQVKDQLTIGATPTTIAAALSLTTDDQCIVTQLFLQSDTTNAADMYLGGVDAAGVADVLSTHCIKIAPGRDASFCPEDRVGDEDLVVIDLRQISVLAPAPGYLLNLAFFVETDFKS